jgi:ribonuclease HI
MVLNNLPIKNALAKPENFGRLAKAAIELGENDISYSPKVAIKGQVLADFMTESTLEKDEKVKVMKIKEEKLKPGEWLLYKDGASSAKRSGAGLIIVNPTREEVSYDLTLNFPSTNNEAGYEAMLVGLRLAIKLKVRHLHAWVDSLLVANQVNGTYEAKEEVMKAYVKQFKQLKDAFETFTLTQIP